MESTTVVLGGRREESGGRDYIGNRDTSRGWTFHSLEPVMSKLTKVYGDFLFNF